MPFTDHKIASTYPAQAYVDHPVNAPAPTQFADADIAAFIDRFAAALVEIDEAQKSDDVTVRDAAFNRRRQFEDAASHISRTLRGVAGATSRLA